VSRVVGGDVVDDAVAFFQAFEGVKEGFRQRAARVNELLAADGTAFVLVASPRRDTVEEAHFFAERLGEAGIAVRGLVVNRVHPAFGLGDDGGRGGGDDGPGAITAMSAAGAARRADTLAGTAIGGLYRNLAEFQAVASREHAHLAGLAEAVAPAPVVWVPFLRSDVHDIAGLGEVAGYVFPRAADVGGG
jgi:anion-transporting  ArsA/GET3 family ATPase